MSTAKSSPAPLRLSFARVRGGANEPWFVADAVAKLALRARLPGAFAFDRAVESLTRARRAGVPTAELLPAALASSWLINNATPSPVFARWSCPPLLGYWHTLIPQLEVPLAELAEESAALRERILGSLRGVALDKQGAGAVSKVLALLVPDNVPVMPDAALAFALGIVPTPEAPDAQTADASAFVPMLGWFARTVRENEAALVAIAAEEAKTRGPSAVRFTPAQVLDRLIWFESVGYRNYRKGKLLEDGAYVWVQRGAGAGLEQAVVHVKAPRESAADAPAVDPVDLGAEPDGTWKEQATAALDRAAGA